MNLHRLVWMVLLLGLCGALRAAPPADLAKVERVLGKEPAYQGKPGYVLLAFGPEARHKAWLVLDGDTLYVDREGTGELTRPDCRVTREKEESLFKVGDLTLGGRRYADLQVRIESAKGYAGSAYGEMPMFKEFLAAQPDGKLYAVSVDVPFDRSFADLRDGSPLTSRRHYAIGYDGSGILQFSARPADAPIIHFGGAWRFWPDGQQKVIRGRKEDLTLRLGTPGLGAGTSTCVCYDFLIPDTAKPHVKIEYSAAPGAPPIVREYILEDRC